MSSEDLSRQLNTAYLGKLLDHTLGKLDQIARDRENATPEAEFDYELPPHSYKFECKQVSAWLQPDEIETLRKTIRNITYWAAEARALRCFLMGKISARVLRKWQDVTESLQCVAEQLGPHETDSLRKTMSQFACQSGEIGAQFQVFIERIIERWAAENSGTAGFWQELICLFHRTAQASGLNPEDTQKFRQDIVDEQYWKYEVDVLKPHKQRKEYEVSTRSRHAVGLFLTAPTARQRRSTQQRLAQASSRPVTEAQSTGRRQRASQPVAGGRVSKPSGPKTPELLRRSARLQARARGGQVR